eukprot:gene1383-2130_t
MATSGGVGAAVDATRRGPLHELVAVEDEAAEEDDGVPDIPLNLDGVDKGSIEAWVAVGGAETITSKSVILRGNVARSLQQYEVAFESFADALDCSGDDSPPAPGTPVSSNGRMPVMSFEDFRKLVEPGQTNDDDLGEHAKYLVGPRHNAPPSRVVKLPERAQLSPMTTAKHHTALQHPTGAAYKPGNGASPQPILHQAPNATNTPIPDLSHAAHRATGLPHSLEGSVGLIAAAVATKNHAKHLKGTRRPSPPVQQQLQMQQQQQPTAQSGAGEPEELQSLALAAALEVLLRPTDENAAGKGGLHAADLSLGHKARRAPAAKEVPGRRDVDAEYERMRVAAMRGRGKQRHIHLSDSVLLGKRQQPTRTQDDVIALFSPGVRRALGVASARRALGVVTTLDRNQQAPRYLQDLPVCFSKPASASSHRPPAAAAATSATFSPFEYDALAVSSQTPVADTLKAAADRYGPPITRVARLPDPYPEVRRYLAAKVEAQKRDFLQTAGSSSSGGAAAAAAPLVHSARLLYSLPPSGTGGGGTRAER